MNWAEIRYALRAIGRTPVVAVTVVLTLAMGIGVSTAIFSVADLVLFRSLPYRSPESLVAITYPARDPARFGVAVPLPLIRLLMERSIEASGFAVYQTGDVTLHTALGEQARVSSAAVSSRFFPLLSEELPALGRSIGEADMGTTEVPVVMLSFSGWRDRFGSSADVLGQAVRLNGRLHTIVGVAPASFRFPSHADPEVYTPLRFPDHDGGVVRFANVIGRLRPGGTTSGAETEFRKLAESRANELPAAMMPILEAGARLKVAPLHQAIFGTVSDSVYLVIFLVATVLVLSCANVISLLSARMVDRGHELALRVALGAPVSRLVLSAVAEGLMLAVAGLLGGLLLVRALIGGFRSTLETTVPHAGDIVINTRTLWFAIGLTLVATVLCAVLPLMRAMRGNSGAVHRRLSGRTGVLLIGCQAAGAAVLLVCGALFAGSLLRLTGEELGFAPADVLTLKIPAQGLGRTGSLRAQGVETILGRVRTLGGVEAVGFTTTLPLAGHSFRFNVPIAGEPALPSDPREGPAVDAVSPGYFESIGATVIQGRDFGSSDTASAEPVAIVNAAFVKSVLGGRDPLGRMLSLGGTPADAVIRIIGVVTDIRDSSPAQPAIPTVYRPLAQAAPQLGWHTAVVAIRTIGDPGSVVRDVQSAVKEVVPSAHVYEMVTMSGRLAKQVAPERQRAMISAASALVAVVLSAVGLYAVVAYGVSLQRREFGLRLALGARRGQILLLVIKRGLVPAALGTLLGTALGYGVANMIEHLLFGIGANEPTIYGGVAGVLIAAALIASSIPAVSAMRSDPLVVFRVD